MILEGKSGNRAIFLNFSPPMGANLSRTSKGQMVIESETLRCSVAKGSLHWQIIAPHHFFNPPTFCFAGQKKKMNFKVTLENNPVNQPTLGSSTAQNLIHQRLETRIWPQDTQLTSCFPGSAQNPSLRVLLNNCMILDISWKRDTVKTSLEFTQVARAVWVLDVSTSRCLSCDLQNVQLRGKGASDFIPLKLLSTRCFGSVLPIYVCDASQFCHWVQFWESFLLT